MGTEVWLGEGVALEALDSVVVVGLRFAVHFWG